MRLQEQGERQSLVVESEPSSVRQIQQWRGSRMDWVVFERFGGEGCAASEDTVGLSDGREAASAGVGSFARTGSLS